MNNPTRPEKHAEIAAAKAGQNAKTLSHNPWEAIEADAVVLCRASKDEGWFEARVVETKGSKILLRWRDYPGFEPFEVARNSVALVSKLK